MLHFSPENGPFIEIVNYLNGLEQDLHTLITTNQSSIHNVGPRGDAFQLVNYSNEGSTYADNSHTSNVENSWFSFSFAWRISITHYALRARNDDPTFHPQSWKLDGSLGNNSWALLHSVAGSTDLVELNSSKTY
jgi:hypothetical protein